MAYLHLTFLDSHMSAMTVVNDSDGNREVKTCVNAVRACLPYTTLAVLFSIVSFLGSAVVIYTFVKYPLARTTSRKVFVYLNIADMVVCTGMIIGSLLYQYGGRVGHVMEIAIALSGLVTIYGIVTSAMETLGLSVYLMTCIVFKRISLANKFVCVFHVISWIMPGFIVGIAMASDVIGYDVAASRHAPEWSWLKMAAIERESWAYGVRLGWELATYLLCIVTFVPVQICIRREKRTLEFDDDLSVSQRANHALRYIPLLYIMTRMWGTVRMLVKSYSPDVDDSWLAALQAIGDPLQGLVNFIVFCLLTESIRERLKRRLLKMFKCFVGKRTKRRLRSKRLSNMASSDMVHEDQASSDKIQTSFPTTDCDSHFTNTSV